MRKIILTTSPSAHVANVLIPAFDRNPDVVTWGTRTFKFTGTYSNTDNAPIYEEAFAVAAVYEAPAEPATDTNAEPQA